MDHRWKPLNQDSKREVRVILHPTAAIWEVRRGLDPGSDDSIDLSDYVATASHSAFDANVTLKFNRELFGANQPKPNQILEIQLKQNGEWKPLWLGIIDAINSYTLQRGERSLQLIAKTREQQDIWKHTKRVTPLFPQMTNLSYMIHRIVRTAGMQHDEIVLLPTAMTTAHSNTQLADMNAWDMVQAICVPLGWTPFIDAMGRFRVADRSLQARIADAELTDERMVKVKGSRQRPPVSRVRVFWLNPTLKMNKQMAKQLAVKSITVGWFLPVFWTHIDFSADKTQRATETYFKAKPSVNRWIKFVKEKWTQQSPTGGRMFFDNKKNFAMIATTLGVWIAMHKVPDKVLIVTPGPGTIIDSPGATGSTISTGRVQESIFLGIFMGLMMNLGSGNYEIWGMPYDWVHARNTSEAFDSSVPTWVDNAEDIETDFIVNEEHGKTVAIRELIYRARSANKWSVTIVDDPRIEYGDILKFPDGSQLYVEDFSRQLERGAEATLDVSGFLVGPVKSAAAGIQGEVPNLPGLGGGGGGPGGGVGGGGEGGGEGEGGFGPNTMPDYGGIAHSVAARYNLIVPADQEEQGKAQLCRAIAWEVYQQDPNCGLFKKTGGNNVMGMSTDVIVQKPDGSFADCTSSDNNGDGTMTIKATWGTKAPDVRTSDMDRWIQPTQALADAPGPLTLKV